MSPPEWAANLYAPSNGTGDNIINTNMLMLVNEYFCTRTYACHLGTAWDQLWTRDCSTSPTFPSAQPNHAHGLSYAIWAYKFVCNFVCRFVCNLSLQLLCEFEFELAILKAFWACNFFGNVSLQFLMQFELAISDAFWARNLSLQFHMQFRTPFHMQLVCTLGRIMGGGGVGLGPLPSELKLVKSKNPNFELLRTACT